MLELISFFTRIPTGKSSLERAAKHSYLLPILGFLIGALVGIFGFLAFKFTDRFLATLLTSVFLYVITGLNHLDGIADFADGIYVCGSRKEKVKALKDVQTGIAGVTFVIFVILFLLLGILYTDGDYLKIIVAEVCAKTAMLVALFFGRPMEDGLGKIFIENLQRKAFPFSLLVSLGMSFLICEYAGLLAVLFSTLCSLAIVRIGHRNFDGIDGNVIGAINEISRIVSLLILTSGFKGGLP